MKSEKGITLISLTIYIIVMTIVIGISAIIFTFVRKNVDDVKDISPLTQYARFNSFFAKEVNDKDIEIDKCDNNYVSFKNGVEYIFVKGNKGIYRCTYTANGRTTVKICRDIEECVFSQATNSNGDTQIIVKIKATGDISNKAPTTYTLKK